MKIEGHLLFRRYGSQPSTKHKGDKWLEWAYEDYDLSDVKMPAYDLKAVFIKRNLCDEYELESYKYSRIQKRSKYFKCYICQHQSIEYIYDMQHTGPVERPVKVGRCCAEII